MFGLARGVRRPSPGHPGGLAGAPRVLLSWGPTRPPPRCRPADTFPRHVRPPGRTPSRHAGARRKPPRMTSPHRPAFEDFLRWADQAPCVPVYRQLTGDGLTPVSAFRKIERSAPSFLFESVIGGEKVGRFSFLGTEPFLRFEARGDARRRHPRATTPTPPGDSTSADPFRDLEALIERLPGRPPAGPAPVRRRRRRLRGVRRRPLHRAPARRPARRPRPARPLVRPLRPDGRSSTTSARRSWSSPTPTSGPGSTPGPPTTAPAPGSTSWSTGSPRPGPSWPSATSTPTARSGSTPAVELHPRGVRAGRPPLPGVHQGGRHLPGRPQPAVPGRDDGRRRSTSTGSCGWSTRARSCSTCRSATSA